MDKKVKFIDTKNNKLNNYLYQKYFICNENYTSEICSKNDKFLNNGIVNLYK